MVSLLANQAYAACGATDRTWDSNSGNVTWSKTQNWSNNNIPNTNTENAIVQAAQSVTTVDANYTVGCLEVTSGELNSGNFTLTIEGDYYRAINLNSVIADPLDTTFTIDMASTTGDQTLESVDPLNSVTISNDNTVTFTESFEIRNTLSITGSGTILKIDADVTLSDTATPFTVPTGAQVEILSGAKLNALGGVIVNGTLIVKAGASLLIGSGQTLSVPAGGFLKLDGSSGNIATLAGNGSVEWNMSVAGDIWANYFRVDRVGADTTGMNITGSALKMDNGEFHYVPSAGYAMTWGAAATMPATMSSVSFFDDAGYGNNGSIDASGYNVSTVSISNWAGLGCTTEGCAYENDTNNRVSWGTQAGVLLSLSTNNNAGAPSSPVTAGAAAEEFAIFAFALNQTSTATDITEITFTLEGTGGSGDVDYIQVFKDNGACQTQGAQIGSNLTFSGSPATATLTISTASDLQVSGTTPDCIHVYLKTTASAENSVTVGVSISGTSDVTNSQGYSFSSTAGPSVSGPTATISGDPTRIWNGQKNTNWADDGNWTNGTFPTSANNCRVGAGSDTTTLGGNQACQNLDLVSGGDIDFGGGANDLAAFGSLSVASGFTFTNSGAASLTMGGISSQSIEITEPFPGNLIIDNSSATAVVSVDGDSYVTGNLTITDGTLSIPNGVTLQVGGNISIAGGAKLDIEPGGTLELTTDTSTITVADGGTLELVGSASLNSTITTDSTAKHYSITVGGGASGTISAQYYTIENGRITVAAGATVDATNDLSNGTFSCPDSSVSALTLNQQVNGDDLDGMAFNSGSCSPASVVSVNTSAMTTTATTLTMTNWSGDLAGDATESDTVGGYEVSWGAQSNTIKLTQEATRTNASGNQGTTQNMGRWGFQQNAGASFSDADLTSIEVTLTGSGSSNDVSAIRLYEDSDCDSSAGTLLGTGTFSGFPGSVTFSGLTVTVPAGASPAMMCVYVEYDIDAFGTNAATIGAEISASTDVVNDQTYAFDASFAPPVDLGTLSIVGITTTWTGAASAAWSTPGNWSSGEPTAAMNCVIPNTAGFDPTITGTEVCNTVSVTNGNLTISGTGNLQVYGSFDSTGTFSNSGSLTIIDDGSTATNQTLSHSGGTMPGPVFDKTAGGTFQVNTSSLDFTSYSIPGGQDFEHHVPNGKTLILSAGGTISSATFIVDDGGTLEIGASQTLTINGGTFKMDGSAEARPTCTSAEDSVSSCYSSSKATLASSSGNFSFSASSGTVYLNGFIINGLDASGLNLSGTAILSKLDGGQFENMAAGGNVIQLNSSGSIPAASTHVGFNWEVTEDASTSVTAPTPASASGYNIVSSTGCGSQTIDFTDWYGDWYEEAPTFDTTTIISAASCTVNFNGSASAVSFVDFTATPYNGAVDLEWETSFELDHLGFNVFRSDSEGRDFIQINSELIRNSISYITARGKYRFIDDDVTNGETYYYYVQDVDIFGNVELHGPKIATPEGALASAPSTGSGVNDGGSNADDGETPVTDPGTIANPSFKDLGDGVQILSQTSTSLRIKVTPPTLNFSTSSWNGAYEEVTMSSYAKTLETGKPELLQRILLIEVYAFATSSSLSNQSITQSSIAAKNIHPAPDWVLNGSNVLVPNYGVDGSFYSISQYKPDDFIVVDSNLTTIGGRKFVKITVNPLLYNPSTDDVKKLDEAVIDIGIDGNAWDVSPPAGSYSVAASIVPNTLRIDFNKEGVFEITYDDLIDSNVEGPFDGQNPADFRIYQGDTEIPMMVVDGDSIFNTGDKIRFYTRYFEPKDDVKSQVTLSTVDINSTGNSPLRFNSVDGDPTSQMVTVNDEVILNAKSEQSDVWTNEIIGDELDHFFWKMIYGNTAAPGAYDNLDMPISLTSLINSSDTNVELTVSMKGKQLDLGSGAEYKHHVQVFVNGAGPVGEVTFKNKDLQSFTWSVPASYFVNGNNTVNVRVPGTYTSGWDVLYVDNVSAQYPALRQANSDIAQFKNTNIDRVLTVTNFSTNAIDVYDVSSPQRIASVLNGSVSTNDGGSSYEVSFFADDLGTGNGKRFFAVEEASYLKPIGLSLTTGYQETLLDSAHHADLLIIGPKELTDLSEELVSRRTAQGLDVKVVTLDQIYAEFSLGIKSAKAIKEFVNYTQGGWTPPYPKYLLILGDGTIDPKNHSAASGQEISSPNVMLEGRFIDYSSDNYYVSSFDSYLPGLAVGRIPTNDAQKVSAYFEKMFAYEDGETIPSTGLKSLEFVSGEEEYDGDDFKERLAVFSGLGSSKYSKSFTDFSDFGSYANLKTEILSKINSNTPLIMTMMAHGANDNWGNTILDSDAEAMTNNELPIIMSLNCENTEFYRPGNNTIGESFLLNENGGAIAFLGANAQTTPAAQMYFANQFFRLFIEETNKTAHHISMGDIMQRSKVALGEDAYSKDIVRSMTLFGDPSMPIPTSLFELPPPPVNTSQGPAAGGCSAVAGEGTHSKSWPEGLMELFFLFALGWGIRRVQRRFTGV